NFLAGKAIDIRAGQRAARGNRVSEWIIPISRSQVLAAVHQVGDVPSAIGVVIVMVRPTAAARLVGMAAGEQPANASRTLKRTGEITPPRVTHRRRVRAVAFLDDTHPVINVSRLALNCPIGPHPAVLGPLAQSAQSIIRK